MLWTSRVGRRKAAIVFTGLAKPAEMARNLASVARLAESGEFIPVIDTVHPLEHAADAYRHVETGHKSGSAVITIGTAN